MLGRMSESSYSTDLLDDELDIIRLQNSAVELAIVPAAGGKILDLIDRRSGRNWLWRNAHIPVSPVNHDSNPDACFASELDSGGWDEVLLSVKPGQIRSGADLIHAIPDHGDLIGSEWDVSELRVTDADDVVCEMTANGRAASYKFERRIRLPQGEAVVELGYALKNEGPVSLPWYWCAHPLLAVDPDASIQIGGRMPFRVDDAATRKLSSEVAPHRWPKYSLKDGTTVDLSQSFAINGARRAIASKVFVQTPVSGSASLLQGGSQITFRFDPVTLPWLGLWINNGAWSGCGSEPYINLGIEPATSPYDCINEAIDNDAVPWIEPGEQREWSLRVELQE